MAVTTPISISTYSSISSGASGSTTNYHPWSCNYATYGIPPPRLTRTNDSHTKPHSFNRTECLDSSDNFGAEESHWMVDKLPSPCTSSKMTYLRGCPARSGSEVLKCEDTSNIHSLYPSSCKLLCMSRTVDNDLVFTHVDLVDNDSTMPTSSEVSPSSV